MSSVSIFDNRQECYVCGRVEGLHRHHVFYGRQFRNLAEQDGAWVYLCPRHHNMSDSGVHFDKALDLRLKREAETVLRASRGNDWFMERYGRSWL